MREKILRSLNSSDLTTEEWENAAHVVASLGAAQIAKNKRLSLGAYLLHLRAGHIQFLPRILALLTLMVVSKARRDGWKGVGKHNAHGLARVAIDRHLNNLCDSCNGVGRIGELGSLIVTCSICKGAGKRVYDAHQMSTELNMSRRSFIDLAVVERVKDVVGMLERMEGYACAGTKAQARG